MNAVEVMDAMEADQKRRYPPYPFGAEFEKRLFALVLKDPTFLRSTTDVLKSEFFAQGYCKLAMKLVETHVEKYKTAPDEIVFTELVRQEFAKHPPSKEVKANWDAFLHEVQSFRLETEAKFLKDKAVAWAQESAWRRLVEDGAKRIDEGRRTGRSDFDDYPKLFDEVRRVGENKFDASADYFKSANSRLASYHEIGKNKIKTWLHPLDEQLGGIENGGLERGELGVIAAPTSLGKSAALVQLGCVGGMMSGQRVLAITLEMTQINFQRRVDRCISQQTTEQIRDDAGQVLERMEFLKLQKGDLRVIYLPAMKSGVKDIETLLLRMKNDDGWEPSVLVVDYATLLGNDQRARERRFEIEENVVKLRALAQEYNLACWTAHQTNRKSIEKMHQGSNIGVEDVAEAFSISMHCDVMITINQTKEERAEGFCKFVVAKNREGVSNKEIPLRFEPAVHRFEALKPGESLPEPVQPAPSQPAPAASPVRDKIRESLQITFFSTKGAKAKQDDVYGFVKAQGWGMTTVWKVLNEDLVVSKAKVDGAWWLERTTGPEPETSEPATEPTPAKRQPGVMELFEAAKALSPDAPEYFNAWRRVYQLAERAISEVATWPELQERLKVVKAAAKTAMKAAKTKKSTANKAPKNKEAKHGQSASKK
jgi:replicative DNA helicase